MSLKTIFENINLDKVEEYLKNNQEEDLHLDFKRLNRSDLHKDDKNNLAKVLSGYANSDGGIIVWGVDACKPQGAKYDCACELVPIEDVKTAVIKLNEQTGTCVSPTVDGVIHREIISEGTRGFIKSFIPASDSGPHMSNRERWYYKRSGDRFLRMEHFEVADMFGRRKRPELKITFRKIQDDRRIGVVFGIENIGRGSAKSPMISVKPPEPFQRAQFGLDGNGAIGLPFLKTQRANGYLSYGADTSYIIHTSMRLEVDKLVISQDAFKTGRYDQVEISYRLSTEDIATVEGAVVVDLANLDDQEVIIAPREGK